MRLFVCVELPESLQVQLEPALDALSQLAGVSVAHRASLHVTLEFLGPVPAGRGPFILHTMQRLAQDVAPLTLLVSKAGAFSHQGRPHALWLGVHGPGLAAMQTLQIKLHSHLMVAGLALENRPWVPHVTLCRVRAHAPDASVQRAQEIAGHAPPLGPWPVQQLTLMDSTPAAGGSIYSALGHAPLGGATP